MIFNVKSGNRDDHSKNFSFLLDTNRDWKLAPAYDLTLSMGWNGEHTAMVNGKGKNITDADLIKTASVANIPQKFVTEAIQRTEEVLSKFERLKAQYKNA